MTHQIVRGIVNWLAIAVVSAGSVVGSGCALVEPPPAPILSPERVTPGFPVEMNLVNSVPVVSGRVNGVHARFQLDTAAGLAAHLDGQISRRARLKPPMGGGQIGRGFAIAEVATLALDAAEPGRQGPAFSHFTASTSSPPMYPLLPGVDGVIGWQIFGQTLLVLDFPEWRLEVLDPAGWSLQGEELPLYASRDGDVSTVAMATTASGDIRRVPFIPSTIDVLGLYMSERLARSIGLVGEPEDVRIGSALQFRMARLDAQVQIGPILCDRPAVLLIDEGQVSRVGMQLLSQIRLEMNFRDRQVRLKAPGQIKIAPSPVRAFGFEWAPDSAGVPRITWVAPGSGAEAAGLEVGDQLVGVGPYPISSLPHAGAQRLLQVGDPVEIRWIAGQTEMRVLVKLLDFLPIGTDQTADPRRSDPPFARSGQRR